jgi:DNA primase
MSKGLIAKASIEALKDKVVLSEVISPYVELTEERAGRRKGLCPFHSESTPSFTVTDETGLWYCFGCGEHGDVFSFYSKIEGVNFSRAVQEVADKIAYELTYEGDASGEAEAHSLRRRLIAANEAAREFYVNKLMDPDAEAARAVLVERDFDIQSSVLTFQVGFAPKSWTDLVRHLQGKGFADHEIVAAGLALEGDKGLRDRFSNRLMWPIRNLRGQTVGFGGRRLADDNSAKYLNTTETEIYSKSSTLYGIDLARKYIVEKGEVIIVEGYTDVMALHAAGIHNVIASSGTAFGAKHFQALRTVMAPNGKWTGRLVFSFDGDQAGLTAAERVFSSLPAELEGRTFASVATSGKDPCDTRVREGDQAIRDMFASPAPLGEFLIRSVAAGSDLSNTQGRFECVEKVRELLGSVRDPFLVHEYSALAASLLGVDVNAISPQHSRVKPSANPGPQEASDENLEWEALRAILQVPTAQSWAIMFSPEEFSTPMTRAAARVILDGDLSVGSVLERCQTPEGRAKIHELSSEPLRVGQHGDVDSYAHQVLARAAVRANDRLTADLKKRLSDDEDGSIARKVFELARERREIQQFASGL